MQNSKSEGEKGGSFERNKNKQQNKA